MGRVRALLALEILLAIPPGPGGSSPPSLRRKLFWLAQARSSVRPPRSARSTRAASPPAAPAAPPGSAAPPRPPATGRGSSRSCSHPRPDPPPPTRRTNGIRDRTTTAPSAAAPSAPNRSIAPAECRPRARSSSRSGPRLAPGRSPGGVRLKAEITKFVGDRTEEEMPLRGLPRQEGSSGCGQSGVVATPAVARMAIRLDRKRPILRSQHRAIPPSQLEIYFNVLVTSRAFMASGVLRRPSAIGLVRPPRIATRCKTFWR